MLEHVQRVHAIDAGGRNRGEVAVRAQSRRFDRRPLRRIGLDAFDVIALRGERDRERPGARAEIQQAVGRPRVRLHEVEQRAVVVDRLAHHLEVVGAGVAGGAHGSLKFSGPALRTKHPPERARIVDDRARHGAHGEWHHRRRGETGNDLDQHDKDQQVGERTRHLCRQIAAVLGDDACARIGRGKDERAIAKPRHEDRGGERQCPRRVDRRGQVPQRENEHAGVDGEPDAPDENEPGEAAGYH